MLKKSITFVIKLFCVIALFLGLQQWIELKTRGFCLQKITPSDLFFNPDWDVSPLEKAEEEVVKRTLNQPYTFLGSGSECFAFLSADGKTVIKFFKLDFVRPIYILKGLFSEDHREKAGTLSPLFSKFSHFPQMIQQMAKRVLGMREFRISRTFDSLKTAYHHFKAGSGLLYLHLNLTSHFHQSLILYDPNGISHTIDLDTTRFYLQECVTPLEKHLLTLKNKAQMENAQKSIDSLCDLILKRCHQGLADRDPYLKNFGFIDNQAIEIDAGSFTFYSQMKEPIFYKQELLFITLPLKEWIQNNYPQLLAYFNSRINEEIARHSGEVYE